MFGVAERGNVKGHRAADIRWIGTYENPVERTGRNPDFDKRLKQNLNAFNETLKDVTVGIAAIHQFGGHSTRYWQAHGIAACSAALGKGKGKGFAVGAAHFDELPKKPASSTLAAAKVPAKHLTEGIHRKAHSWAPKCFFLEGTSALIRLFR